MDNPASYQFTNNRSVRFALDNFALPVVVKKKKNSLYTNYLVGLKGTKNQLASPDEPQPTYDFGQVVRWGHTLFAGDTTRGLYYSHDAEINFQPLETAVLPQRLAVVGNRLFVLGYNRDKIVYSVDLSGEWSSGHCLEGFVYLPADYGTCLDIRPYRGKLLVVCENGLLTINRHFTLEHLADDSEILKANLTTMDGNYWESDWFSLGYATDTQILREIFLKTNAEIVLTATSNRTQRQIHLPAATRVQKIKVNLKGDQFKLRLALPERNALVSDLAVVISYGKRR